MPLIRYCCSIYLLFTRAEIRSTLDCKSFQYYSPKRGLSRFKSASLSYYISVVN
nr:MAG TPA: conotoxin [Caudoviricetes sp.]